MFCRGWRCTDLPGYDGVVAAGTDWLVYSGKVRSPFAGGIRDGGGYFVVLGEVPIVSANLPSVIVNRQQGILH